MSLAIEFWIQTFRKKALFIFNSSPFSHSYFSVTTALIYFREQMIWLISQISYLCNEILIFRKFQKFAMMIDFIWYSISNFSGTPGLVLSIKVLIISIHLAANNWLEVFSFLLAASESWNFKNSDKKMFHDWLVSTQWEDFNLRQTIRSKKYRFVSCIGLLGIRKIWTNVVLRTYHYNQTNFSP